MGKIDLTDVTFTIPVRYDTDDRIENVCFVIKYLLHHFDTNIIVMEESNESKFSFLSDIVEYHFFKTDDPNLHRTRCLNDMAKLSKTPIIVNYDTDVLFPVENYVNSANIIRKGEAHMVFPYEGPFMECSKDKHKKIKETLSVDHIKKSDLSCNHPNSVGGCVFWDKNKFIEIGMENENFKSWGWEDNERITRAKKLGVLIKRTSGFLIHLSHKRLKDSTPNNIYYKNNEKEFQRINKMTNSDLKTYVKNWEWCK